MFSSRGGRRASPPQVFPLGSSSFRSFSERGWSLEGAAPKGWGWVIFKVRGAKFFTMVGKVIINYERISPLFRTNPISKEDRHSDSLKDLVKFSLNLSSGSPNRVRVLNFIR